jgi:nicotinamidase-related amidase
MAAGNKWMIDPDDAVMLLIDHQSGLFQLVRDMELPVLRSHATALAKVSYLAKIPTFTTASVPDGPNGPLIPEIHECNPDAVYIPRSGQINAWDNPKWVEAIEKTKRRTLLIAGTFTSICMAFPALSAVEAGYKVFCIIDASGNWSKMATDLTVARIAQAGVIPIDINALLGELMGTWNRPDAMDFASITIEHVTPAYRTVMENYDKAQSVQKVGRETKLDKLEAARAKA